MRIVLTVLVTVLIAAASAEETVRVTIYKLKDGREIVTKSALSAEGVVSATTINGEKVKFSEADVQDKRDDKIALGSVPPEKAKELRADNEQKKAAADARESDAAYKNRLLEAMGVRNRLEKSVKVEQESVTENQRRLGITEGAIVTAHAKITKADADFEAARIARLSTLDTNAKGKQIYDAAMQQAARDKAAAQLTLEQATNAVPIIKERIATGQSKLDSLKIEYETAKEKASALVKEGK